MKKVSCEFAVPANVKPLMTQPMDIVAFEFQDPVGCQEAFIFVFVHTFIMMFIIVLFMYSSWCSFCYSFYIHHNVHYVIHYFFISTHNGPVDMLVRLLMLSPIGALEDIFALFPEGGALLHDFCHGQRLQRMQDTMPQGAAILTGILFFRRN